VTPFTIIAWLAVRALNVAPMFNASFRQEPDVIEVHRSVHLGVATTTDQGLMVVVIRDADLLGLEDFGLAMRDLIQRARSATLTPQELTGSTFTVNNFGALGLDDADPIINYPEAAILGVGSIRSRPAVVEGAIVPRPLLKFVAAFDHRVCDGAEAGRYLSRLKDLVEHPGLSFPETARRRDSDP
jgi:pyruvate dehydrogenase E2 component (dihydrolipoamide acetyltransferase)